MKLRARHACSYFDRPKIESPILGCETDSFVFDRFFLLFFCLFRALLLKSNQKQCTNIIIVTLIIIPRPSVPLKLSQDHQILSNEFKSKLLLNFIIYIIAIIVYDELKTSKSFDERVRAYNSNIKDGKKHTHII